MNTYYIDCNKSLSLDKDNEDNSVFTTQLKKDIKLTTGSNITIQSSFVNQQGITGDSLEIEEDIEEEFKFFYYKNDTTDHIPAFDNTALSDAYFTTNFSKGTAPSDSRQNVFGSGAGNTLNAGAKTQLEIINAIGSTEQPMILCDLVHGGGTSLIAPRVGTIEIKIKKGVYGITQIADLITDQINNRKDLNGNEINPIQQKIVEGLYNAQGLENLRNTTLTTISVPSTTYEGNLPNVFQPSSEDYVFIDCYSFNDLVEERIGFNDDRGLLFSDGAGNGKAYTSFLNYFKHTSDPSGNAEYDPLFFQKYIGTTSMTLDYEGSGFSLNNLHTPYTIPSHDYLYNPQALKGKNGVFFRRVTNFSKSNITGGLTNPSSINKLISSISNPLSRVGGIMIHNFGFKTAMKYGTKKNINLNDDNKGILKFKEFFNNENEARLYWKKTIWHRLGFSYDQLNSDENFEQIRYYNNDRVVRLRGITTNTYIDNSIIPSISGLNSQNNFSKFTPPSGSSQPARPELKVNELQVFNLQDANTIKGFLQASNAALFTGTIYPQCLMIPIEAAPRPIIAQNLPILSTIAYYLITSDILDGYNDVVNDGDPLALIGVVPKSSLSNQDFIYSSQDIVNTITNEKVINKIKIKILKPDLTSPSLEPNSSVIIKIDVPIPQPIQQNPLVEEDPKNKKK